MSNRENSEKREGIVCQGSDGTSSNFPVEEDGRLSDPRLRENFIVRVFAYYRLRQLYDRPFSRRWMVEFHAAHKYLLLAHSPRHYKLLGQLAARIGEEKPSVFRAQYRVLFMRALQYQSAVSKNINVLQHIAGFLKKQITDQEKTDIHRAIFDYHRGLAPLVVPVTLIRHFINKYEVFCIQDQFYLNRHPAELMLRNHV